MAEDEVGSAAEKRKRELKGDIDYKFIQFDDLPRAFGEGVEGLYAQPIFMLTGGLTTGDKPGPLTIDGSNRLEVVSSPGIGSGGVWLVGGNFTKSAVGTTGGIYITPAADDVLYFMYGYTVIGAARATSGQLFAGICGSGTSGFATITFLRDSGVAANEIHNIPGLGEANTGIEKTAPMATPLQCMIPGVNHVTEHPDATAAADPTVRFVVENEDMANTETFGANLYFFSMTNTQPTVGTTAGTWA
jgi:hypothetical protein